MMTPKKNVGKCFDYANGKGAYRMVFVAPDEVERGMVRVKGGGPWTWAPDVSA